MFKTSNAKNVFGNVLLWHCDPSSLKPVLTKTTESEYFEVQRKTTFNLQTSIVKDIFENVLF